MKEEAANSRITFMLNLTRRWESLEFKDYVNGYMELLKVVAAGNGAGVLALGAFLASTKLVDDLIAAKVCMCVFLLGSIAAAVAYWVFLYWVGNMDQVIAEAKRVDNKDSIPSGIGLVASLHGAAIWFSRLALVCFITGCAIATVAILFTLS